MPTKSKVKKSAQPITSVDDALAALRKHAKPTVLRALQNEGTANGLGVHPIEIGKVAARCGKSHALAEALWATGVHEAQLLAVDVDEPALATVAQLERWSRGFSAASVVDGACWKLFMHAPGVFDRVGACIDSDAPFVRRAGFMLLGLHAAPALPHDDSAFLVHLPKIETHASDPENVRTAVEFALRSIGQRNRALRTAAVDVAQRLKTSKDAGAKAVAKAVLTALAPKARDDD